MSDTNSRESPDSRPRFFYGYVIVIAAFCIMLVYMGARSIFGVFFKPMADELKWSSAALSSTYSLSMFMEGGIGIVMGIITDKLGPKIVIIMCGLLLGLGFFLMSRIDALWQMYVIYGLLIGAGMSGIFVPLVTTTSRWFVARRSMMTGLILTGTGIGILISAPVANWLISAQGWRNSYIIFGVVLFVVFILAALFLKRDPSQAGQMPDGRAMIGEQTPKRDDTGFTLGEAIATRQFWFTFFTFFSLGLYSISLNVHIVPHIINLGYPPATGATVLAIIGGAGIIGRLAISAIADRIGNRQTFVTGFIISFVITLWLAFFRETWGFYLYAFIWGLCMGGVTSLYGPMVAELFGLKWHGLIFGVCGFGAMLGGTVGPTLTGYIFDLTGSYQTAFFILAAFLIAGLIFSFMLKPLAKENQQ